MAHTLRWDLYRTFLAVLAEGSLSGAARALDLTQPTAGRHISELEAALGLSLFTRSQTGLLPTAAAQALRADAEAMHNLAEALVRTGQALGEEVSGLVRISASEVVGAEVLPPLLAALQRDYPRLHLELLLSNKVQDLTRREVDIAVRMTPPTQEVLLATRVGEVVLGLHAHRDYLARRGHPASPADLAEHTLIGFAQETPYLRAAKAAYPWWQPGDFALRCDSDLAQLALIRAGAGIGICQVGVAQREPQLVRILATDFAMPLHTWVAMNEGLRHSTCYLTVFQGLVQGLRSSLSPCL